MQASFQHHKGREASLAQSLLLRMRDLHVAEEDWQTNASNIQNDQLNHIDNQINFEQKNGNNSNLNVSQSNYYPPSNSETISIDNQIIDCTNTLCQDMRSTNTMYQDMRSTNMRTNAMYQDMRSISNDRYSTDQH